MIGIELKLKEVSGVIRRKGIPVDSFRLTQALAVLSDQGYVIEVLVGEASIVIRDLYKRFLGKTLDLKEAEYIVEAL